MKAHEYWSVGALITMLGTFYSGYKGSKSSQNYGSGKKNINTAICANMLRNFILYAFRYG